MKPKKSSNFDNISKIAQSSTQGKKMRVRASQTAKNRGYTPPDWFKKIKTGSHGSTPTQKRLWTIVSEYVRKRDFQRYNGKCISCDTILSRWQDGQAAHYIPYSRCHGMYKFDPENIYLSCAICNTGYGGAHVGYNFGNEIVRRQGHDALNVIDFNNESHRGEKMHEWDLVEMAERLMKIMP